MPLLAFGAGVAVALWASDKAADFAKYALIGGAGYLAAKHFKVI